MEYFVVGVDAGGSRTVAAIARGLEILRTATGDGANPSVVGTAAAAGTIERTIDRALAGERPAAIVVGAAGAASRETSEALRISLARRFSGAQIAVCDDASIALRAAVPEGDGLVLIAGTGSIAYAEIRGRQIRSGGYGYLFGDSGSGFAVGAAALRRLLRALDGLEPYDTMLSELQSSLRVSSAREAVARIYESAAPATFVAAYAPLVLRYAAAGDSSAQIIVDAAASALVELVSGVLGSRPEDELPIALSGGLLREKNVLSECVRTRIAAEFPTLRVTERAPEAFVGALVRARALLQ